MDTPEVVFSEIFTTQRLKYDSEHYHIWKLKFNFILTNKGIDYVLNEPQPPDRRPTHHLHQKWLRDDTHCRLLIHQAVESKSIWPSGDLTAKSMMDCLDCNFRVNRPQIQHQATLFHRYVNLQMDEGASMRKHVLEMRAAAYELEIAGVKVPDEMQAVVLMNSLPESWSGVAYFLSLQLGKNELSFDNVSQKLRAAAEMRPPKMYVAADAGSYMYCCRCRQFDQDLKENSNSVESNFKGLPFGENHLDYWESRYHKLKAFERLNSTGTNYFSWMRELFSIIDGLGFYYVLKQRKPSEPTDSSAEQEANNYKKWLADDFTCRHLILGAMEDNLLLTFQSQPTATRLLSELHTWFDFPSLGRRMTLFRQYVTCSMSDYTKIDDHICSLEAMVREVRGAGMDVSDEIQAVVLIDSLPLSWSNTAFTMTQVIDEETKAGVNILDSAIMVARRAATCHPPKERTNSNNNNYKQKSRKRKRKRYNRRYSRTGTND